MTANVNVTKVLFKRGNTAQNAAYTGINGEITVDTQAKTLRVHDGVTTGGNIVTAGAMASYIPTDPTITSIQANITAANAAISAITGIDTSLLANAATQQTQINLINANVAAANALIPNLLAVSGNIIPGANVTYSLGSETRQWRDLWVSNNTIYIGNTPIRVDGGTLLVNGAPVATTVANLVNGAYNVELDNNGDLTVPNYINFKGNTYIGDEPGSGSPVFRIVAPLGYGATIETDSDILGNSWTWTFGVDGTLGTPGDITAVNFIGDGSQLTGLPDGTAITNGTSTIDIPTAGSNIYVGVNNIGSTEFTVNGINTLNLVSLGNVSATKFTFANGVNILSTVGAAAGNISVDTSAIQFVASSSGDGNGYSTVRIIPDTSLEGSDQYLIVDPTAPGHIHIRAGGTQDNSSADLILGGENSHVLITAGSNPPVYIRANSASWAFGVDSSLSMPTGGNLYFDSSAISVIDGFSSLRFADATTQTTAWTGSVTFGNTIAIGYNTGTVSQGGGAVAVGSVAGNVSQGVGAVAVGEAAGRLSQGAEGIAVGKTAGEQSQGAYSIAIGSATAYYQQGTGAVAIGTSAGALQQGNHAIAIGTGAGSALQGNNSIILNATGSALEQTTANTFTVAPIRNVGSADGVLQYNATTNEVSYNTDVAVGEFNVAGNITQQSAYYETYANVTNSGGNLTCNFANGSTFYATLTANVTVNFANVAATAGQVTGATLIVDQGATAYSVANIQINSGGVQTIKWAGGTTNTGTASNTDIMSFSLISLDGTSWRILGQTANYA